MIVAGIDEAGYGPVLGPLVVGCCAMEVDADPQAPPPCLWKRLTKLVSKHRSKTGRKIHVNDSKDVYSPSIGLKELERAVLAIYFASLGNPACFGDLLAAVAPEALEALGQHAWYAPPAHEIFPIENEAVSVRLFANGLAAEMQRTGTRCVRLAAQVIPEGRLNKLVGQTRNKASTLFSTAATHLDFLLRNYGSKNLVIFCDRQGGREHYAQLLRLMFEQWPLEVLREEDGHSEYLLHQPPEMSKGHEGAAPLPVRIIFREKAEALAMPVALASMISKYLREGLMRRFNAFWSVHVPGVEPTAGYYNDGLRFLRDIECRRKEMGIRDEALIRCR